MVQWHVVVCVAVVRLGTINIIIANALLAAIAHTW